MVDLEIFGANIACSSSLASAPFIRYHQPQICLSYPICSSSIIKKERLLKFCYFFVTEFVSISFSKPLKNICQQAQEAQDGESWKWTTFSADPSATIAQLSWIDPQIQLIRSICDG